MQVQSCKRFEGKGLALVAGLAFRLLVGLVKPINCAEKGLQHPKNQLRKKLQGSTYAFEVVIFDPLKQVLLK
jgi:hypothetical protein